MSFLKSTTTFSHFKSVDPLPEQFWTNLNISLLTHKFRDIDEISSESISVGWASFDDLLDTDLRDTPIMRGTYAAFALRIDTRKIPAEVLKKHTALALEEERKSLHRQGKKFISRERKQEIKDLVKSRLCTRYLPIPQHIPVVVSSNGEFYLASNQDKIIECFENLIADTFDVSLSLCDPFTLADKILPENINIESTDVSLGSQFLAWLWWRAEEEQSSVLDYNFSVAGPMSLVNNTKAGTETVTLTGKEVGLGEGYMAMSLGKYPSSLKVLVDKEGWEWSFNLNHNLYFIGLKTPKIDLKSKENDIENEALFLEKIGLIEEMVTVTEELFTRFIKQYTDKDWCKIQEMITIWAKAKTV